MGGGRRGTKVEGRRKEDVELVLDTETSFSPEGWPTSSFSILSHGGSMLL